MGRKILKISAGFGAIAAAVIIWLYVAPVPWGIPVLEYHMVTEKPGEEDESDYVTPAELREQLDYIREQGYTTITMLEFMKARKGKAQLPEKPIILTFDDGYEDNYSVALPMLEERGMKAMVYMVTNMIGHPGYLGWEQLRDMQDRGFEIGSHTANHLPLTSLGPEEKVSEVQLSKLLMEWNGIRTVFSLSYPNGRYDGTLPKLLEDNEYLTAVTGDPGLNDFDTDPFLMQRINIPHSCFGLNAFKWRLLKAEWMTKLGIMQHR